MGKKHGPWTITNSETKYKNPWIEIVEHKVIGKSGKPGIFGIMLCRGGSSILPIDKENNVYLVREFAFGVGNSNLKCCAGCRDEGENFLTTAKRELEEETGIVAGQVIDLGKTEANTSISNEESYIFLAKDLEFKEPENNPDEQIEVVKVPFEKAVAMVMESEITHAPTCTLILKTKISLGL